MFMDVFPQGLPGQGGPQGLKGDIVSFGSQKLEISRNVAMAIMYSIFDLCLSLNGDSRCFCLWTGKRGSSRKQRATRH